MRGQRRICDVDDRLKRLSYLGDQLEAFRARWILSCSALGRYYLSIGGQRGIAGGERFRQPYPLQEATPPRRLRV